MTNTAVNFTAMRGFITEQLDQAVRHEVLPLPIRDTSQYNVWTFTPESGRKMFLAERRPIYDDTRQTWLTPEDPRLLVGDPDQFAIAPAFVKDQVSFGDNRFGDLYVMPTVDEKECRLFVNGGAYLGDMVYYSTSWKHGFMTLVDQTVLHALSPESGARLLARLSLGGQIFASPQAQTVQTQIARGPSQSFAVTVYKRGRSFKPHHDRIEIRVLTGNTPLSEAAWRSALVYRITPNAQNDTLGGIAVETDKGRFHLDRAGRLTAFPSSAFLNAPASEAVETLDAYGAKLLGLPG